MRTLSSTLLLGSLILSPLTLSAQASPDRSRWSLEATTEAAVPMDKLGVADLSTGFGLGFNLRMRLQPHLFAYAGWEWHRFESDELIVDETSDAEDTGYTLGLRFEHPFKGDAVAGRARASGAGYWLRLGALVNHIEIENEDGDIVSDTKHGLGWEGGAGLSLPLNNRLALTPGVRYRSLSRDLTLGATTRSVTLGYVTAGVGLALTF